MDVLCAASLELSNYLVTYRCYISVGTSIGNTGMCSGVDVICYQEVTGCVED